MNICILDPNNIALHKFRFWHACEANNDVYLMKTNKNGKSILLLIMMMMMINGHSKHGVHCDIILPKQRTDVAGC